MILSEVWLVRNAGHTKSGLTTIELSDSLMSLSANCQILCLNI